MRIFFKDYKAETPNSILILRFLSIKKAFLAHRKNVLKIQALLFRIMLLLLHKKVLQVFFVFIIFEFIEMIH